MRARGPAIIVAAVLVLVTVAGTRAQQSAGDDTARAIRELTAEVRNLRTAIAQTSHTQTEGQMLGVYLTVQQSRVSQAASRLDGVRREAEDASNCSRERGQAVVTIETRLSQTPPPEERRALEAELRSVRQDMERCAGLEQQARAREAEAYAAVQQEEMRWNELVARLEQLLKK